MRLAIASARRVAALTASFPAAMADSRPRLDVGGQRSGSDRAEQVDVI
jgi:hypothetical protein